MLILRISELVMPRLRVKLLSLEQFGIKHNRIDEQKLQSLLNNLSYSDWLLLYCLGNSMDRRAFKKLIESLCGDFCQITEDEETKPLQNSYNTEDIEKAQLRMLDNGSESDSLSQNDAELHRNPTLPSKQKLNIKKY